MVVDDLDRVNFAPGAMPLSGLQGNRYQIMAGRTMNDLLRATIALSLSACIAGCAPGDPSANTTVAARPPLAGARIGGPFTLTDQDGKKVSDTDFAGKYRIIYFGYTYCPDVCPVDVQNLAMGLRILEKTDPGLASRIVPIFITVDPARDTPPVLKQFVSAFHPRMIGLTGSADEIADVAADFAIFYQAQPPGPTGAYTVNHSRQAYLFGPDGKPLALLSQEGTPQAIATEIKRWAR